MPHGGEIIGYRRDGRTVRLIAGGDGTNDGGQGGSGTETGTQSAGQNGVQGEGQSGGQSDGQDGGQASGQDGQGGTDLQSELDKWKAFARQNEQRAKDNADKAKRLDKIEEDQKTESQKVADRAAAAEKARDEANAKLTRYEVAREKGVPSDLVDFLSASSREEMEKQANSLLSHVGSRNSPSTGNLPQGPRGSSEGGPSQLSRSDLANMTPEQISKARKDGRLNDALKGAK